MGSNKPDLIYLDSFGWLEVSGFAGLDPNKTNTLLMDDINES